MLRRNVIVLVVMLVLAFSGKTAIASITDPFSFGGKYNPIYVEVQPDPMEQARQQAQQNQMLENSLMAQYGSSIYLGCRTEQCSPGQDLSNPSSQKQCLQSIQYCLARGGSQADKDAKQRANDAARQCATGYVKDNNGSCILKEVTCATGYIKDKSGSCVFPSVICAESYTNTIWTGQTNSSGGLVCDCNPGWQWNSARTACILKAVECPNGSVKNDSGLCVSRASLCSGGNTEWLGLRDSSGKIQCSCKSGFVDWDYDRNACITQQEKDNDLKCREAYGGASRWSGQLDDQGYLMCRCSGSFGFDPAKILCVPADQAPKQEACPANADRSKGFICACKSGYDWNKEKTACVLKPKPLVLPKVNKLAKKPPAQATIEMVTQPVAVITETPKADTAKPSTLPSTTKKMFAAVGNWFLKLSGASR